MEENLVLKSNFRNKGFGYKQYKFNESCVPVMSENLAFKHHEIRKTRNNIKFKYTLGH